MKNATIQRQIDTRKLSQQRGASLLEGIAYLGIAAIVILGAVALLTTAFGTAQSNRASEEIVSLRTAAKKLYAGQTYPTDLLPAMISAAAIPGTLIVDTTNNTVKNSWGGAVTISGTSGSGTNSFTITNDAVPQDACVSLISGATGWTQVAIGSNTITTFPVPASSAASACASGANSVSFTAS